MIEDQIMLALQDIAKIKDKLKAVKKDVHEEEKIVDDQYIELKKTYKDIKLQVKDFEIDYLADLQKDESYNKLREMKIGLEEDLALAREKLFENISKLPQKAFNLSLDTEGGPVKVQVQPEMRVYINGKEEKKSV
jgi:hypothetical protein